MCKDFNEKYIVILLSSLDEQEQRDVLASLEARFTEREVQDMQSIATECVRIATDIDNRLAEYRERGLGKQASIGFDVR